MGYIGMTKANKEDMAIVKELLEVGKIKSVIDRRYPLSKVAEAFRYLEGGHTQGKLVVTVEQNN